MSDVKRRWVALLGALALAAGCTGKPVEERITVKAVRGDLVFAGSYYGEIEPRKSHPILAPQMRNVWQLTVESVLADGAQVKQGDVVLRFARDTLQEDLREREAELSVAEASFNKTREQLADEGIGRLLSVRRAVMEVEQARLNVVEGVNLISRLELDKAKVDLSRAELNLELKRKELASFEKKKAATLEVERLKVESSSQKVQDTRGQLELMDVTAPADGVLYAPYTRLNWQMGKAAPGVVVRPGDRILEIPELDAFNVSIYVRQRDATLLKVGNEATVVPTMFPDSRIKAKIIGKDEFSTTRNARTGTSTEQGNLKEVKVVLELEQTQDALRPGGTVRADVESVLLQDALLVPLAALSETGGGYTATLQSGRKVKVKVGQTSTTHAQVLEGLSAGDVLVLERSDERAAAGKSDKKG
jgi:HlyD family secretion protein